MLQTSQARGSAPNLEEVLNNPETQETLGNLFGQGGGGINFGEILNNPMFQSMAQQMMQNPQMMNMYDRTLCFITYFRANSMMQNPEALGNLMNMMGQRAPNQPQSPPKSEEDK